MSSNPLLTAFASPLIGVEDRLREMDSRLNYGSQRLQIVKSLMSRNGSVGNVEMRRLAEQRRRDALLGEIDSLKAELEKVSRWVVLSADDDWWLKKAIHLAA